MQIEPLLIQKQIYKQKLILQIQAPKDSQKISQYLKIISDVLEVDKELNIQQFRKTIKFNQQDKKITVEFQCVQLKLLRSCILGFFKHMHLVAKTIQAFKQQQ